LNEEAVSEYYKPDFKYWLVLLAAFFPHLLTRELAAETTMLNVSDEA
jgi:hypothetical protein